MKKWIKIVLFIVEVLLIVLLIIFGAISTKRGKTIKIKDIRIEQLMNQRDSLTQTISKLGAESCISVTCNVNIKNTAVFSASNIHADAVATTVASITRQEILNYKDSIDKVNAYNVDTIHDELGNHVVRTRK